MRPVTRPAAFIQASAAAAARATMVGQSVGLWAGLSSPLPFSKQQKVFVNKNRFQEEEEIENKASLLLPFQSFILIFPLLSVRALIPLMNH